MTNGASEFVLNARRLASINNYKTAFQMYMCAFDKEPSVKKHYENEFLMVLTKLNKELAHLEHQDDIFTNFEKAINAFPGNVDILNGIGAYLYSCDYFAEALCHFEKALNIDGSLVSIEKNLNNAKTYLFPKNHFRILNDQIKNCAYKAAIKSCVTADIDSVIDIDAGTGLLALYANEFRPIAITACESSTTMARVAECVMQENHAHEVVIVNKPSVTLTRTDIYGTRSVLLTDMIDAGLFGDYILQSLCHAWENLLFENSKIIPGRAEYFIAGVKCDELNKKYKLGQGIKNILNVPGVHVHTATYCGETYYSDDVHLYDDVKYMCEPQSLLKIDFNSYKDVRQMMARKEPFNVELTARENGEMNMVIGWFNLHLTDSIMLTSDPRYEGRATAWQQATFFDVLPKKVSKGQKINIGLELYGGRLTTLPDPSSVITRISPETIAFLNDTEYMDMIVKCVGLVCVQLGQFMHVEAADVVDLNPFPLLGILLMRRGANSLVCHAKTYFDEAFLRTVLVANQIPKHKVTILVSDYTRHAFKKKKYHVIFSNYLDFSGDIDVRRKHIMQHLRYCNLAPGGIYLPESVSVVYQLISSPQLEAQHIVSDGAVSCRMARHVNRYRASAALHLDAARLSHVTLSDTSNTFALAGDTRNTRANVTSLRARHDACSVALLCWYRLTLVRGARDIQTNRSNSFVQQMAYMTDASVRKGDLVNIITCVDQVGSFKFVVDVEPC